MAKRKVIFGYSDSQPQPADPYLMRAFCFSDYDLHFNQQGDLSETQFYRLQRHRNIVSYLFLASVFIPLIAWYSTTRAIPTIVQMSWLACVMILFVMPLMIVTVSMWRRYELDIYDSRVRRVTGAIKLNSSHHSGASMIVADQVFRINRKQWLVLKNHKAYTIYFVPNTKIVLSIKPIS